MRGLARSASPSRITKLALAATLAATTLAAQRSPSYSSSTDAPVTTSQPAQQPNSVAPTTNESAIPNADRLAVDLRHLDLDMHLNADTGAVTTRARIRLRNSGASPLKQIELQISGALQWQSARLVEHDGQGAPLPIEQSRLATDADHTGTASELTLALPKPLQPGAELSLDLYYGGTLAASAERLERLGAPADRAAAADWDTVSPDFIGLRGFGNVLWYPVAAPATLLADGDRFARATEQERERTAGSEMQLELTLEHTGPALANAWFLGQPAPLVSSLRRRVPLQEAEADTPVADPDASTLDTAHWDAVRLDGRPVTLFVAGAPADNASTSDKGELQTVGATADTTAAYTAASATVSRFLHSWIPNRPAAALTVIELPAPGTQAFADGPLLVAPLHTSDTRVLAEALVYPMASAAVPADAPAWLREGLPEFLRILFLESTAGRDRMLAELDSTVPALRLAESARGMDPAPLRTCVDTSCARIKAAYALLMLRTLAGTAALEQALAATLLTPKDAATSATIPANPERGYTRRFQMALAQSSGKDLAWFFHDWFDVDRGLPDLQIVQVAPRRVERNATSVVAPKQKRPVGGPIGAEPEAEPDDPRRSTPTAASRNTPGLPEGSWLVAVEVQNNGDATAEVPVIVRSNGLQNQLPLRVPPHGRATIRVPFETAPEQVEVNDGTVPEQRAATHHRAINFSGAQ